MASLPAAQLITHTFPPAERYRANALSPSLSTPRVFRFTHIPDRRELTGHNMLRPIAYAATSAAAAASPLPTATSHVTL